jgi:outer membrane protein OmpA-like peptidoglycan-associated protein/tetratricopeptide (TPR) repeat protein
MMRLKSHYLKITLLSLCLGWGIAETEAQHRQVLLGDSLYRFSSYAKAIGHYEKALKKVDDPLVVHEKLGNSYYQLQNFPQALEHYEQAWKNVSSWEPETRWKYLQVQRALGHEDQVREYIASWASLDEDRAGTLENGIQAEALYYMDSAAYDLSLTTFNSDKSDFSPAYFKEGLVFSSSRGEGNTSNKKFHWDGGYHLDLFYVKPANGNTAAEVVPTGDNMTYHDGPAIFYARDTRVIFTRNEEGRVKDGRRVLQLMQADINEKNEWINIRPLLLNSEEYSLSHPALSEDEQTLYFISNMPGGQGGTDIWKSQRNGDQWGSPVNMGNDINTSGNEMFPFVYGEEFFFASDGHPGLGGLDIFLSEPLADNGYLVRNVGYPMNTSMDDFGLITRNGREGYFSSNRAGQDDIYYFLKDKTLVDIFYVDEEEQLLDSVITDLNGKKILPITNRRVTHLILPMNSVHGLSASKENYSDTSFSIETKEEFYIARTIPLKEMKERGTIDIYPIAAEDKVDFYLGTPEKLLHVDEKEHWQKMLQVKDIPSAQGNELERLRQVLDKNGFDMVVHDTITSIYYDFDKYAIRTSEETNLSRLISLLKKYPESRVVLSAHTDARGSNAYNDKLALKRARSAKDYLIANGIVSERIEAQAYGETQLLIRCEQCTEAEHQMNRRATFGIDKKMPLKD